jgi:hypothetical protein
MFLEQYLQATNQDLFIQEGVAVHRLSCAYVYNNESVNSKPKLSTTFFVNNIISIVFYPGLSHDIIDFKYQQNIYMINTIFILPLHYYIYIYINMLNFLGMIRRRKITAYGWWRHSSLNYPVAFRGEYSDKLVRC